MTKVIQKVKPVVKKTVKKITKSIENEDVGLFSLLKEKMAAQEITDERIDKYIVDMRGRLERKQQFLVEDKVCILTRIANLGLGKGIQEDFCLSVVQDFDDMDESDVENGHMIFS